MAQTDFIHQTQDQERDQHQEIKRQPQTREPDACTVDESASERPRARTDEVTLFRMCGKCVGEAAKPIAVPTVEIPFIYPTAYSRIKPYGRITETPRSSP